MPEPVPPALEMLWEPAEPKVVLETRFGFVDAAAAADWVSSALAEHWDIRVSGCDRIVMSDHNALAWVTTPRGRLLAKWCVAPERFPRLEALARLTAWLDAQGFPVSAPVATPDDRLHVKVDGASVGLQREIGADLLDVGNPRLVREAGGALARLHDVLAEYRDADRVPADRPAARPLAERVGAWLESAPAHAPATACAALRARLAGVGPGPLPVQLVHGDFRSANVLCDQTGVAAVLDFEEARFDHRIVDVARSAVLLGTRFHDWGPVSPDTRSQFLDGYQAVRVLTRDERAWWDVLVPWISLSMTPPGSDPTGWAASASYELGLGLGGRARTRS